MARPRTPTKILELRGAYKNHPERRRDSEPVPTGGIGDPPKSLKRKALKNVWFEIIANTPLGVLTNADRTHLEIICHLLVEFRKAPAEFPAPKLVRLESMLGKIGLNPSDRAKVAMVGKKDNKNEFARL